MDKMEILTMSSKELNRLEILGRVLESRLTQVQAAPTWGSFAPIQVNLTECPRVQAVNAVCFSH
jgi:hypothetical protein